MLDKEILRRYFENRASEAEVKLIDQWLLENDHKEDILKYIEDSYHEVNGQAPVLPFDEVFEKIKKSEHGRPTIISLKRKWIWVAAAACILFLFIGGLIGYLFNGKSKSKVEWVMNTAQTSMGQYAQITLSDGSDVYLSDNSKISFSDEMSVHPVVYLEGEAYFDLHNNKRNLIIKTKDLVTTTKNSKFNITAFNKDSTVTVRVVKGKAEVVKNDEQFPLLTLRMTVKDSLKTDSLNNARKSITWSDIIPAKTIKANEKAVFDKNTNQTEVVELKQGSIPLINLLPVSQKRGIANHESGDLFFQNANVIEVVYALQKKYNLNININTNGRIKETYSGNFKTDTPANEVLKIVCNALGLSFELKGNDLNIYSPR